MFEHTPIVSTPARSTSSKGNCISESEYGSGHQTASIHREMSTSDPMYHPLASRKASRPREGPARELVLLGGITPSATERLTRRELA